jgi:hypothetical protein
MARCSPYFGDLKLWKERFIRNLAVQYIYICMQCNIHQYAFEDVVFLISTLVIMLCTNILKYVLAMLCKRQTWPFELVRCIVVSPKLYWQST